MMNALRNFLKHLFTGIDNHTFDIARVLWFVSVMTFLALAVWHVVINKQGFDASNFGLGAGGMLAGGGAGLGLKGNTEPTDPPI